MLYWRNLTDPKIRPDPIFFFFNQKKKKKNDRPTNPKIFYYCAMVLLEKTETHSNRKYQTANMAAAGYSLLLVGKYGVKSIFQSIKRAESHILVGDFVQNVCDEFCQGYVVVEVQKFVVSPM